MIALLPNCVFLSETSRMLHVAQALQARGETVAVATHGGPFTRVLDEAGMTYELLPPVMDSARGAQYLRDLVQIGKPGVQLQPAEEVRRSVEAEVAFFRKVSAGMAVTGFTLTTYLSTRVAGIALAASHGGSYVPPVFEHGLAPAPTTMPMPGVEWLPAWLKRRFANNAVQHMRGPTRFLNTVAAELGVEPVPTLAALMLADLTLVTDVPEVLGVSAAALEAWRPASAAYRTGTRLAYVGPMFARLDLPVPPAVQAFLDGRRPTACVVLSSCTTALLRAVVQRVREAGLRVIVGATIHDFGPTDDPDLVIAGILPNHRVLPFVDVAITMGGQGTVQTCMASGTPLVGIPLHAEQELNVDLAARQGMAIAMAPRHAGSDAMTAAVRRIVAEPAFRTAARRVQQLYAGRDGAREAAARIAAHLHAQPSRPARAPADGRGTFTEPIGTRAALEP